MHLPALAAGWLVSAAAGFIFGLTGFGFGLAFGPAMVLVAAPRLVVTATDLLGIPLSFWVARSTRRRWLSSPYPLIVAAGLLGVPAGTWLLARLPAPALRGGLAALAFAGTLVWLLWRPRPVAGERARRLTAVAALLAGIVNGASGMGGPVLALFAATQRWDRATARAALAAFNLATFGLALGVMVVSHTAVAAGLGRAAAWLPTALGGAWLGGRVSTRVPAKRFPTLLVLVAAVCAAAALVSLLVSVTGAA